MMSVLSNSLNLYSWMGVRSKRSAPEVPVRPQVYPEENSQAGGVWECVWSKELVKRLRKNLCYLLSLVLSLLPKSSGFHGACTHITATCMVVCEALHV